MLRRSFLGLLVLLGVRPAVAGDMESAALWRRLEAGGHVVLMRHAATVPGVGDPANFKLGACATQRNLSDAGREDARRIGAAFRERAVPVSQVLSGLCAAASIRRSWRSAACGRSRWSIRCSTTMKRRARSR